MKKLKIENTKLHQDLRRKEKALAEASALLIMKKKADLIWGGRRGRMILDNEKTQALSLINEACDN